MAQISIIVPVYKVEAYLRPCIDSLLAQTFQDIEIILVDDGSPDSCGHICDEYVEKDSRVRVIHQKNAGLSCARNTGVDAAASPYLCFVDSDDLVTPDYCQTLYDMLVGSEADFSVVGVLRFPDGEEPKPEPTEVQRYSLTNQEFLEHQLTRRSEFGVWDKLFRRELFAHIRFAPGRIHEDVIFSGDLVRHLRSGVVCTRKQCYLYRQRQGGIVSAHTEKCSPDRIFAGRYLVESTWLAAPELLEECLHYAILYPWSFIDRIYVTGSFRENREFLYATQVFLREYMEYYEHSDIFTNILRFRMVCFAKSRLLYGCNAYLRLARTYLYRLINKDAYADGHGI